MIKTVFYQMTRRDWVWLFVIAAILSLCGTFGVSYVNGQGYPLIPLWTELLISLVLIPVVAGVFFLLDVAFAKFEKGDFERSRREFERLTPKWTLRSIALFTLVMIVLWTPWYIANFPGAAYWDTYYQIFQVYPENHPIAVIPWGDAYDRTLTDAWLVDHHPIVVTMIYGAFGWVSDQLTGNWMAGVAIFTAIQGILHCIAFTSAVAYLRRIGCSPALCFVAYLFFALMPFVPTWAMCMVKDSMFGLLYVPYFMMLIEIVRTRGHFLTKRSHFVWFVVLAVVMCITKKQAIFVIVATSLIGFIVFWWRRRKDATEKPAKDAAEKPAKDPARTTCWAFAWQAIASLVVLIVLFPMILFPALNIEQGGKQEVLGPLFQQTARYIVDYGDEVTDDEREAISAVLDYDKIAKDYTFNFEDSVKYRYNIDATNDDLLRYLGVYVTQGFKHPDAYFGAWMGLAGYYVAPTAVINIRMTTVDTYMGGEKHEKATSDSSGSSDSDVSSSALTSDEANAIINEAVDKAVAEGRLSEGQSITPELLAEMIGDDTLSSVASKTGNADDANVSNETDSANEERHMLWNPEELSGMRTGIEDLYEAVGRVPVINFPLLIVTYALWMPALFIYVAQRRRMGSRVAFALAEGERAKSYKAGAWAVSSDVDQAELPEISSANASGYAWVILLIPQLVLLAFCIIAPVYDGRYVIPIFDVAPLLYCGMCILLKQRDHTRDEALEREVAGKVLGTKSKKDVKTKSRKKK